MQRSIAVFLALNLAAGFPSLAQTNTTPAPAAPPIAATAPQTTASSSAKMTNTDVIELVGLGLSNDVIIDKIFATKDTNFDTSVSGLKHLKPQMFRTM